MKQIMPIEDYHKHPAISKSKLDLINKSIYHFLNPVEKETDSLTFGSALHDACLSPNVFKEKYFCLPDDFDGRKKEGKEIMAQCKHFGTVPIKNEEYLGIISVVERMYKNPIIKNMLLSSEKEISYFAKIKIKGRDIDVRCRPDVILNGDLLDIKTTRSTDPHDLKWAIKKWRYYVQDPFYSDVYRLATGEEIRNFMFLFIENKPPYHMVLKVLDRESEDLGRKHYKEDLIRYVDYLEKGVEEMRIETVGLPSSSFYEESV